MEQTRKAVWSSPLRKDHHDNRVTGLRLFGDRPAGVARAVDTVRNSGRVEPAVGRGSSIDHSSTGDSPPVPPSVMPEALSNSARGCITRTSGWMKTSQVIRSDGVLAPHRHKRPGCSRTTTSARPTSQMCAAPSVQEADRPTGPRRAGVPPTQHRARSRLRAQA